MFLLPYSVPKAAEKPEASGDAPKVQDGEEKEAVKEESTEKIEENQTTEKNTKPELSTVSQLKDWLNEKARRMT